MCYHKEVLKTTQELATLTGRKASNKLQEQWQPKPHLNGFDHPFCPILLTEIPNRLVIGQWGLIPNFVNNPKDGKNYAVNCLNAKAETMHEKAAFKEAKACLIPVTGFFEWQLTENSKQPYYIHNKDKDWFYLAGIYHINNILFDKPMLTYALVTTQANKLMAEIHTEKKRMPVFLNSSEAEEWLLNKPYKSFVDACKFENLDAYRISNVRPLNNKKCEQVQLKIF